MYSESLAVAIELLSVNDHADSLRIAETAAIVHEILALMYQTIDTMTKDPAFVNQDPGRAAEVLRVTLEGALQKLSLLTWPGSPRIPGSESSSSDLSPSPSFKRFVDELLEDSQGGHVISSTVVSTSTLSTVAEDLPTIPADIQFQPLARWSAAATQDLPEDTPLEVYQEGLLMPLSQLDQAVKKRKISLDSGSATSTSP